ncbi:MAG: Hsp20/alpha crystallin family protein [Rhodospirillales bacterium]|nr:Hsp20/alpha crystallin family protein [Rhodospirillales bacterium]
MSKAKKQTKSASSSAQEKSLGKSSESCCVPDFSALCPQGFFGSTNAFFQPFADFQKQAGAFFMSAMKDLSCATPPGSFSSCGIPSVSDFQAACRSFGFPVPGFDLREDDSCFTIAACVPETSPENVDVSVSDGCVTISCCAQSNETRKEKGATQNVFSARSFYKTIALPDVANTSKAEADFKNGILTITVPKRKDTAKKIPISRKSA